jgi:hypothetical protein
MVGIHVAHDAGMIKYLEERLQTASALSVY